MRYLKIRPITVLKNDISIMKQIAPELLINWKQYFARFDQELKNRLAYTDSRLSIKTISLRMLILFVKKSADNFKISTQNMSNFDLGCSSPLNHVWQSCFFFLQVDLTRDDSSANNSSFSPTGNC